MGRVQQVDSVPSSRTRRARVRNASSTSDSSSRRTRQAWDTATGLLDALHRRQRHPPSYRNLLTVKGSPLPGQRGGRRMVWCPQALVYPAAACSDDRVGAPAHDGIRSADPNAGRLLGLAAEDISVLDGDLEVDRPDVAGWRE